MPDIQRAIEACLDPQQLRTQLQPHFAAQGQIDAVRITKSRRSTSLHKHPHPLVFCCEIDLQGHAEPQRWLGKLHRSGAADAAVANFSGAPVLLVSELDLLLWPWPHDPALPQLPALLDAHAVQPLWDRPAAHLETLRYEPERRALLRYTRDDGAVLYAKTYADGRARSVARRFEWMWTAAQTDGRFARVARPLEHGDEHTLWQAAVAGTSIARLLEPPGRSDWVAPLALALASLHAAPTELAGASPRSVEHWLAEVRRRRNKIERACPELAAQAEAVAQAITRAAPTLPASAPSLIHGDFHPDQAWLADDGDDDGGGRIVLFDFDEFALGDPMEDLAEFIVKLPLTEHAGRLTSLWLGAYAQAAPTRFCRARLSWHMAVQQLLQASRAFVFQVPQWREQVRERLARAQQLAAAIDLGTTP